MEKAALKFWGTIIAWTLAIGVSVFVIVVSMLVMQKRDKIVEKCASMCDPYVVESCGKDARTATCKTTKGYYVRIVDENGDIVSNK